LSVSCQECLRASPGGSEGQVGGKRAVLEGQRAILKGFRAGQRGLRGCQGGLKGSQRVPGTAKRGDGWMENIPIFTALGQLLGPLPKNRQFERQAKGIANHMVPGSNITIESN